MRAGSNVLVERYVAASRTNGVADDDVEQAWADYRLATLFDFVYPVIAGETLDLANDRAVRAPQPGPSSAASVAAFEHLDCEALFDLEEGGCGSG